MIAELTEGSGSCTTMELPPWRRPGGNYQTEDALHQFLRQGTMADRRRRIHDLVLALIAQQKDLDLLTEDPALDSNPKNTTGSFGQDPASWLDRNRRIIQRYQALVRSGVTLDALTDQELSEGGMTNWHP